jgi:hypothetical protein
LVHKVSLRLEEVNVATEEKSRRVSGCVVSDPTSEIGNILHPPPHSKQECQLFDGAVGDINIYGLLKSIHES